DDDERIGVDLRETFPEHVELTLAARVAITPDVDGVLFFEMVALAQLIELLEVVGARPERQRLVPAVNVGAQIPFMRRRCQERAVRGSEAENDLGHLLFSRSSPKLS